MKQWQWDGKTWKFGGECHTGNTAIYTEPDGGTLFIGGWTNGAIITANTHVIDLSGTEHKYYDIPMAYDHLSAEFLKFVNVPCKGWLSLPFPDMGVPDNIKTFEQWQGIAGLIRGILKTGTDVLVACQGGHGRSGMFCAIVGHILGVTTNRAWASPVEHIRSIHCNEAVETFKQEEYVYDVLKLDIKITRKYIQPTAAISRPLQGCPVCGTQTVYAAEYGMCLGCSNKFSMIAPVKMDLTEDDILHHAVKHECNNEACMGIFKAEVCGHTVHDMLIQDGLCEVCQWDEAHAPKKINTCTVCGKDGEFENLCPSCEILWQDDFPSFRPCVLCGRSSAYGYRFGVCFDCSKELKEQNAVDFVHNSITDPYRAIPHNCDNHPMCIGIVVADVCGHVTHNREVQDGLCESCLKDKEAK